MAFSKWNTLYADGPIHDGPSQDVVSIVPLLRANNVVEVLDAGCGTGRHSNFLGQAGFHVHGVDVSEDAVCIATAADKTGMVDYKVLRIVEAPFPPCSMDFILASHSLEYASDKEVETAVAKLTSLHKSGGFILVRVVSTKHVLCGAGLDEVYGVSSVSFCIRNGMPVHFFTEHELRKLFCEYDISRLEHREGRQGRHKKITVPLSEWILFGRKK